MLLRPYTGTCKIWRVLGLNHRRGTFRGVCFCALHGYMRNLAGFIFPHTGTPKTHLISPFPIRIYPKHTRFYTQTFGEGHFGAYAICPARVRAKFVQFHNSTPEYAKNAPDFTFPNKDTPKSRPILDPNPWRGIFRGVCFYAPTRVRAKIVRFHISAPEYTKNAPDFTLPNRDAPKARPILDLNL